MALPISRDFDAVDAGPLPANTVNNLQDNIIGKNHGAVDFQVPIAAAIVAAGSPLFAATRQWEAAGVADQVEVELFLPVGSTISEIEARVLQVDADQIIIDFRKVIGFSDTSIDTASDATTGDKLLSITGLSEVIVTQVRYYLVWESASINDVFYSLQMTASK